MAGSASEQDSLIARAFFRRETFSALNNRSSLHHDWMDMNRSHSEASQPQLCLVLEIVPRLTFVQISSNLP